MIIEKYFKSKLDFVIFSCFLMSSIALALIAYFLGGVDFGVYYAAGKVFLQGGNPYDFSQLINEIVSSTGATNNPYYYAPWFTWVLSLFAIFPYDAARILWAVVNYGLWIWGLFNLSKLLPWPSLGWQKWGVYLYLTFVFAWATWGAEQVGIIIFLIITFILISFKTKKWIFMGVWMALLLFKPNITSLPVLILSLWLIVQGKSKPIVSMLTLLASMIGASLLISPGWYVEIVQPDKIIGLSYTLNAAGETQIERYTTTLLDWLSVYQTEKSWAYSIYGVSIVVGVFYAWKVAYSSNSVLQVMSAGILVTFALVPYALFYDYPPLALTLFYINFKLTQKPQFIWLQWLMNCLIFLSLFIGGDIRYRYWVIVILIVSSLVAGVFRKDAYSEETIHV